MRNPVWATAALLITIAPAAAAPIDPPAAHPVAARPARRPSTPLRQVLHRAPPGWRVTRQGSRVRVERLQRDLNRSLLEEIQGLGPGRSPFLPEFWPKAEHRC